MPTANAASDIMAEEVEEEADKSGEDRSTSKREHLRMKTMRSEVVEPTSKVKQRILKENRDLLKNILTTRGDGCFLRGWRRELDHQGKLEVDFQDFAKCARRLHFEVNTDLLFGLDDDHSTMTLEELSPQDGLLLDRAKWWIQDKFGSTQDMFRALDSENSGKLTLEAFMKGCETFGLEVSEEEFHKLFHCADVGNVGFIQEDDVIFLELDVEVRANKAYQARVCRMDRWKYLAAHEFMEHIKRHKQEKEQGMRITKGRKEPKPWLDKTFEQLPAVAWYCKQEREITVVRNSTTAVAAFKKHLQTIYGDEIRALRRALDSNQTYNFTFKTLRRYVQKHNLHINVYDLWKGLDRDEDEVVRIEELSVKHAFALSSLRTWARTELGSCAKIWDSTEAMDASRERTGSWFSEKKMLTSVFIDTLGRLGWPGVMQKQTLRLAVAALDALGCGVVTKADLEWLDKWQPLEWIGVDPDPVALQDFKARLEKIYGHPLAAWRKALDTDDSNRVTWHEFLTACKKIRFPFVGGAWRALDHECCGSISIEQFEPDGAELLRSFKEWAEVHFGSVKRCWKAIDSDGVGYVTLGELKRTCLKLNWTGDVPLLFDCLDVDGQLVGEHLARSLYPHAVAFLDSWHFGITEFDAAAEEAKKNSLGSPQHSATWRKQRATDLAALTARLTVPIGFPRHMWNPSASVQSSVTAGLLPEIDQMAQTAPAGFCTSAPEASASGPLATRGRSGAALVIAAQTRGCMRPLQNASLGTSASAPSLHRRVDALLATERSWG